MTYDEVLAARAAAWDVARAASAAWAATRDALDAASAVRDAAWAAASDAARDAERLEQERILRERLGGKGAALKFCWHCKHCDRKTDTDPGCLRPDIVACEISLVTGKSDRAHTRCEYQRGEMGICGMNGMLWEPREGTVRAGLAAEGGAL